MPPARRLLLAALAAVLLLPCGCNPERGAGEDKAEPLSADLIIVGDGMGGLAASLEASRKGAAVVLLSGGSPDEGWMWDEGVLCPEGASGSLPPLEAAAAPEWSGSAEWHRRLIARHAAADLGWLSRETGVSLIPAEEGRYLFENLSREQGYRRLEERARQEGVRLIRGAEPERLLFGAGGRITGITYSGPDGTSNEIYAPAMILADGGYLNDPGQVEALEPGTTVASWRKSGNGSSMRMARAAGLDLAGEPLFSYTLGLEKGGEWIPVDPPPDTLVIVDGQVLPFSHCGGDLLGLLADSPRGVGYLLAAVGEPGSGPDWTQFDSLDAFMERYGLQFPELSRRFGRTEGHFQGGRIGAVAAYCLHGIAVNQSGQVLRDEAPVPGLYALGETAGGLHGEGISPGMALIEALVWGRYLGAAAVDHTEP